MPKAKMISREELKRLYDDQTDELYHRADIIRARDADVALLKAQLSEKAVEVRWLKSMCQNLVELKTRAL